MFVLHVEGRIRGAGIQSVQELFFCCQDLVIRHEKFRCFFAARIRDLSCAICYFIDILYSICMSLRLFIVGSFTRLIRRVFEILMRGYMSVVESIKSSPFCRYVDSPVMINFGFSPLQVRRCVKETVVFEEVSSLRQASDMILL